MRSPAKSPLGSSLTALPSHHLTSKGALWQGDPHGPTVVTKVFGEKAKTAVQATKAAAGMCVMLHGCSSATHQGPCRDLLLPSSHCHPISVEGLSASLWLAHTASVGIRHQVLALEQEMGKNSLAARSAIWKNQMRPGQEAQGQEGSSAEPHSTPESGDHTSAPSRRRGRAFSAPPCFHQGRSSSRGRHQPMARWTPG